MKYLSIIMFSILSLFITSCGDKQEDPPVEVEEAAVTEGISEVLATVTEPEEIILTTLPVPEVETVVEAVVAPLPNPDNLSGWKLANYYDEETGRAYKEKDSVLAERYQNASRKIRADLADERKAKGNTKTTVGVPDGDGPAGVFRTSRTKPE